jgi:general secretion pathway protein G
MRNIIKDKGFTLLELLIVIVIIGILALIIVPGLASGPKRARDATRKSDLRGVKNAMEAYYTDKSMYPAAPASGTTVAAFTGLSASLVAAYLPALPKDPKDTAPYQYQYSGKDATTTSYDLGACLENTGETAGVSRYSGFPAAVTCTAGVIYIVNSVN